MVWMECAHFSTFFRLQYFALSKLPWPWRQHWSSAQIFYNRTFVHSGWEFFWAHTHTHTKLAHSKCMHGMDKKRTEKQIARLPTHTHKHKHMANGISCELCFVCRSFSCIHNSGECSYVHRISAKAEREPNERIEKKITALFCVFILSLFILLFISNLY